MSETIYWDLIAAGAPKLSDRHFYRVEIDRFVSLSDTVYESLEVQIRKHKTFGSKPVSSIHSTSLDDRVDREGRIEILLDGNYVYTHPFVVAALLCEEAHRGVYGAESHREGMSRIRELTGDHP